MKIIAHRGASGYAPENTILAFDLALKMGAVNFEFDIHRTSDGFLVVHHNFEVIDGVQKYPISKLTLSEIKKINLSKSLNFKGFSEVPTLQEVLKILENKSEWLNLEIKNDGNVYPNIESDVLKVLREFNLEEKSLISSFDFETLQRIRELSADIKIGILTHKLTNESLKDALLNSKKVNPVNFHISSRIATKQNVDTIKEFGLNCCVYTVNKTMEALQMQLNGADGIFTNYPDILMMGKDD